MATVIDSLLVALGFQVKPEGLEGFAKLTEKAKTGLLTIGAAAGVAIAGVKELVHGAAERLGDINSFSQQMGLSARSVAALGQVALENDSSLGAMEGGLRGLTIMAGQAEKQLGRGAMVFQRFGLHVKDANGHVKTTEQLLGDVAEKLAKTSSRPERLLLGSRLGFDPALIEMLSKGRVNFEKMRNQALEETPFNAEDFEAGGVAETGFKKAGAAVTLLRDRIAVQLFPAVNEMLAQFVKWTKDPEKIQTITRYMKDVVEVAKWIAQHFGTILKVAGTITALKAGKWFFDLGKDAWEAGKAVFGLVKAFGWLRAALMAGVLGALVLLGQDLWVFYHGGRSVTGWMLTKFPEAVRVMEDACAVLGAAFLAMSLKSGPAGLMVLAIYGLIQTGKELKDNWQAISDWWEDTMDGMFNQVADFVNPAVAVLNALGWNLEKMDKDVYKHARNTKATLGALGSGLTPENENSPSFLNHSPALAHRFPAYHPTAAPAVAGNVHSETHVGQIHVHVKGGEKLTPKDAMAYAKEIKRALELERLMSNDRDRVSTRNDQPATAI